MKINPEAEARLLQAIRRVPDNDTDAAFKYASDRLRPILWPTIADVDDIARDVVRKFGAFEKEHAHG